MASKLSFRQHLIFLLILDLILLIFVGAGASPPGDGETSADSSSVLIKFLTTTDEAGNIKIELNPLKNGSLALLIATMFTAFTAIGLTAPSGSGVTGTIGAFFGKSLGTTTQFALIGMTLVDYVLVYNLITSGTNFILLHLAALFIFVPMMVDALFASVDWVRGVSV